MVGAVKLPLDPPLICPVSKPPDEEVTVWGAGSLLSTVTFAPGFTVREAGENLKLLMVMEVPPVGAVVVPEPAAVVAVVEVEDEELEEQAARPTARVRAPTTMRSRRPGPMRVLEVLVITALYGAGHPGGWELFDESLTRVFERIPASGGGGDGEWVIRGPARPRRRVDMIDSDTASDAALVVAIGRWHEPALAEAYRRHGGAVHALAARVMGSATLAEEITQEVFLELWNRPERFDPARGALRTFLMTKAHGRAVDVLRSDAARRAREERTVRDRATAGYDIEHHAWDLSVADQVKAAVGTLPEEERRAIELAYFGGHTYREVASLLGEPEGTVKSRIRSGLRRLKTALVQHGVEEPWTAS